MTTPSDSTYIPVTTLSNFRANLVPPSLSDLFYLQQGSEHDRDSAATLGQILESGVISSFVADNQNWRTFTASEAGIITLGDYNRNVIIVPSAKDQDIRLDHFPTNGLIIYAPDWDSASASTAVTIKVLYSSEFPIIKGGIGIFLCSGDLVIGESLICNSAHSLARLKELSVDNLIVESDVALQYGSNAAFNVNIEPRVVLGNTYYDLVITSAGGVADRKIKILGDSLKIVAFGINPSYIDFDDGLKNTWRQIGSDDFKTLTAEHIDSDLVASRHIDSDLVSSKRRVYKDVDISGSGDSTSNTQTQYETSLGRSTSFYYLGSTSSFTFDKTTCEIGEEVLLFKYSTGSVFIRTDKDDSDNYSTREVVGLTLLKMVYLGLNPYGNPLWVPLASPILV